MVNYIDFVYYHILSISNKIRTKRVNKNRLKNISGLPGFSGIKGVYNREFQRTFK